MDNIKEWIATLSGIIVFGSICEMIMPEGKFNKYTRLVIGLILVIALISPVYSVVENGISDEFLLNSVEVYNNDFSLNIDEYQKNKIISLYKRKLEEKAKESVLKEVDGFSAQIKFEVEEGDEKDFGAIKKITVLSDSKFNSNQVTKIKRILKNDYQISENKIVILHFKEKQK